MPFVTDLPLPPPLLEEQPAHLPPLPLPKTSAKKQNKLASIGSFFKSVLTQKPPVPDTSFPDNKTIPAKTNNSGNSSINPNLPNLIQNPNQSQTLDDTISLVKNLETKYTNLQKELAGIKSSGLKIEGQAPNNRIIEKTVERITSGLSQTDLDSGLSNIRTELDGLNTKLTNQIANLSSQTSLQTASTYQAISLTNKIDNLSNTTLSNPTITGTLTNQTLSNTGNATIGGTLTVTGDTTLASLTASTISLSSLSVTSTTATSTFAGAFSVGSTTPASNALFSIGTSSPLFVVDKNTGYVGIGTTNPGEKLEVVGDIISTGTKWTSRTSAADKNWKGAVYGNGLFVAVSGVTGSGTTNRVMTSPDGINWTARNIPTGADKEWEAVTYGNGLFVAVARSGTGNRVMTSPDGINWTARTSAADNSWYDVTYGNGLFVAVAPDGTNRVMTSPDGINWTARAQAADNSWFGITYGNGLFVAIAISGTTNRVMTSPDGINWTIRTSAEDSGWSKIVYGNGLFVATAYTGTNRVMTSPDGINWTARTVPSSCNGGGCSWMPAYGDGLFVLVGSEGVFSSVATSPDGINWTARTAAADNDWYKVIYGNGVFVAVARSGTGNRVMTSGKMKSNIVSANNIYQGGMNIYGNIGLGTSSPYSNLSVWGGGIGTTRNFEITNNSSTTLMSMLDNGTGYFSGNIGIGTTSPYAKLSVVGPVVAEYFHATSTTATSTFGGFIDVLGTGSNATSTFSGNLWVKGTLRAAVSYVGDLIFANNFRFTEADPILTGSNALYLQNQFGSTTLAVDENGNVGIGTTSPAYKLQVMGDIAATSFVNISTRDAKKDINYLTSSQESDFLNKIKNTNIANYHYSIENQANPLRLGLIAEEAPSEILSVDGKGVDVYKMATFTLGGVKALQKEIEKMKIDITALSAGAGGAISGSDSLFSWITDKFKTALGIGFGQGKLCLEEVCINKTQLKELLEKNNISSSSSSSAESSSSSSSSSAESSSSSSSSSEASSSSQASSESSSSSEAVSSSSSSTESSSSSSSEASSSSSE